VLKALRSAIAWDPERTFVVFLGDNIYPRGLTDSSTVERKEGERILNAQIDAVLESGAEGIMVPGNHDWDAGSPDGWAAIIREDRYVDARGGEKFALRPSHGCPGPEVLDWGEVLRLIVLDTEWWLHPEPKPSPRNSGCKPATEQGVIDSIRVALATAGNRRTVVVGHHPMVSGGEHGGYFDWPTYLFPFHPWVRLGGLFARQDISGREYRNFAQSMQRAFIADSPMVFAAGHEHNLQVIEGRRRAERADAPARWLVVSGSGIFNHTTATRAITGTRYVNRASGFFRLTFLRDGRVRLAAIVVDAQGEGREDFSLYVEERRFPVEPVDARPDTVPAESAGATPPRPD
jgi:hypothetical protein